MKKRESASRALKVTDAVKQARAQLAAAEAAVETERKASREARHKRKLAKAAARRAKKRLTQAKKELAKAECALAEAESKVPVKAKGATRAKRAVKMRPPAEEKKLDPPAETGAPVEADIPLVADTVP